MYYVFYIVASTIKDNKGFQGSRIESASGLTSAFASKHLCSYFCSFIEYFKVLQIKPSVIQIPFFREMILIRRWWEFRSWTATGNFFFPLCPATKCESSGKLLKKWNRAWIVLEVPASCSDSQLLTRGRDVDLMSTTLLIMIIIIKQSER